MTSERYAELRRYLLEQSERCTRPPVDRFRHRWLSPMPVSPRTDAYLRARVSDVGGAAHSLSERATGDGFKAGDYSLGLFHHDASEASIELLRHEPLRDAAAGSLLCLLDCATPDGRVHRAELPHKSREGEPSKPVIAQYALRATETLGDEWAARHRLFERVLAFIAFLERHYVGLHGLFLTHSSLQTGFDNDLLSVGLPDKTVEGPDTNAFMVLEYRALAALARRLGAAAEADRALEKADVLAERMERLLWHEDDRGGFYVGLRWLHGVGDLHGEILTAPGAHGLAPVESWTTLLPLYAGVPSPERAKKMFARLFDPAAYWSDAGVRTVPADSVFFQQAPRAMLFDFKKNGRGPVSNWNGPIWILANYYLAEGLARYGEKDRARELAIKTAELLSQSLAKQGALFECYDDSGRGLWPLSGTFISWNVLALTLLDRYAAT